jgi:hypothetical protein
MAKPTKPNASRNALRDFIGAYLTGLDLDEPSDSVVDLTRTLEEAINGLDDLDKGETPPIFAPNRALRQKVYPAQIRKLHIQAVVHLQALRRLKNKKALEAVAGAIGKSPEALRSWEQGLKKEPKVDGINELKQALHDARMVERTYAGWNLHPTAAGILVAAKRVGQRLTALEKAKFSGKVN